MRMKVLAMLAASSLLFGACAVAGSPVSPTSTTSGIVVGPRDIAMPATVAERTPLRARPADVDLRDRELDPRGGAPLPLPPASHQMSMEAGGIGAALGLLALGGQYLARSLKSDPDARRYRSSRRSASTWSPGESVPEHVARRVKASLATRRVSDAGGLQLRF